MTTRERVGQLLEQAFQDGLPEGLEDWPRAAVDRHALWSAMTSLTQEVRLQGRAFKQLEEGLQRESRVAAAEAERKARLESIDLLLAMRDRLARGLACLERRKLPWWQRWMGLERSWRPLTDGYRLNLEQLDGYLERLEVREIPSQGQAFDPHRMQALEIRIEPSRPEGTVLEVLRPGYTRAGETYRPAQVVVSKIK